MSRRHLLCVSGSVLIFLAAVLIYRVHFDSEATLLHTGYESLSIADSIASHGTFSDPFRTPTGPSAFLAPAYPAFLALVMKIFGTGAHGYYALQWFVTLFIASQLSVWPWITRRMQMGYVAGFIAAAIWLASIMPSEDVWEAQFVGLLTVALAMAMYLVLEKPPSRAMLIGCGFLWGAALLFSPVTLLVLLGWSVWLLLSKRVPKERIVLLVAIAVVCLVPWTIRNYSVFHRLFFIRDNLGLELDLGNNDCAAFAFDINFASGCFSQLHPNDNPQHAALVRQLGEIEYFHRHKILAQWWITHHPSRFARLTAQRTIAFWIPSAMSYPWRLPYRNWIISAMNLLGLVGVVRVLRLHRDTGVLFLLWIALFPIVYYFVPYSERYREPVLWMTFLPAGYTFTYLRKFLPRHAD